MAGITSEGIVVLLVLVGMFLALFFEVMSPEMIVFTSLMVVWNVGVISTADALSGFSNEGMITVGALFIVVKAVERSGLVDRVARRVFGQHTSKRSGLLRLQLLTFSLSGFFNNTPLVALLMPITRDWARSRGFAPSQFLMPLSFSSIVGGLTTIIGTSTNLVVQGLLQDEDRETFGFFEPAILGVVLGAVVIAYCATVGQHLLPKNRGGMFRLVRDRASDLITEIGVSDSCPLKGLPMSQFLESIGVDEAALLKVRRPCSVNCATPRTAAALTDEAGKDAGPLTGAAEPRGRVGDEEEEAKAVGAGRNSGSHGTGSRHGSFDVEEGNQRISDGALTVSETSDSEADPVTMDADDTGVDIEQGHSLDIDAVSGQLSDGRLAPPSLSEKRSWMPAMTLPAALLDLRPVPPPVATPGSTIAPSRSMLRLMQRAAPPEAGGDVGGPEVRALDVTHIVRTKKYWGPPGQLSGVREGVEEVPPEQRRLVDRDESGESETSISPTHTEKPRKRSGTTRTDYRRKYLAGLSPAGSDASFAPGSLYMRATSLPVSGEEKTEDAGTIHDATMPESLARGGRFEAMGQASAKDVEAYAKRIARLSQYPGAPADTDVRPRSLEMGHLTNRPRRTNYRQRDFQSDTPLYIDILPVPSGEVIQGGDVVFLSIGAHAIASFRQTVPFKGLKLLDVDVLDMTGFGTEVAELLLSDANPFLGQELGRCRADFQKRYSVSIIAVRGKGGDPAHVSQAGDIHTRDLKLRAGDTVLVNAFEDALDALDGESSKDFYLVTRVGSIPLPATAYDYAPVFIFVAMLVVVTSTNVPISRAAMTVVAILVIGRWVSSKDAIKHVDFKLLALIGSALGLSRSISASGLSDVIADAISNSGLDLYGSLFLLYFVVVAMTELVTNNAAAALAVPIAIQLSDQLEVSHFPFAAAVLFGASTSFATPVGYQTNTMVWGPGGYHFSDFIKVGLPLDIAFILISVGLIPLIWPF